MATISDPQSVHAVNCHFITWILITLLTQILGPGKLSILLCNIASDVTKHARHRDIIAVPFPCSG
jgi:hypothetical protein